MNSTEIVERIRARAKRLNLSNSRLAVMADLHKNTLRHFNRPGWSPRLQTLQKLESALDEAERQLRRQS